MKKLILFILIILFINLVYATHIIELKAYPKLEENIEKYLGNHDVKITKLEYSREIILHEQNLTTLKLTIKHYNKNKLIVYDILPRDFINDANEFILDVNTNYTILNNNIVLHYIDNFNKDFTIEYLITGKRNYNVENFQEPIFLKPINLPDSRPFSYLLVFFGIIFVLYLIKKIKNTKLRGVRIR